MGDCIRGLLLTKGPLIYGMLAVEVLHGGGGGGGSLQILLYGRLFIQVHFIHGRLSVQVLHGRFSVQVLLQGSFLVQVLTWEALYKRSFL